MLSYEGIFFDKETVDLIRSLEKTTLAIQNDDIHLTFKYHPNEEEIFDDIVGKEVEVLLVGYGCDGKNSGFSLKLPDEMLKYYINYDEDNPKILKVPHITSSLSEDAKPYKTKDLHFKPLSKPIPIKGRFGYWIKKDDDGYISYKPYKDTKNK